MEKHVVGDIDVIFDHGGRKDWGKYTFPVYYGMPVILRRQRHEFHFNQLGQVRRIYCHARYWPNAQETLKRTIANDWIFMSTFGYEGSYDLMKSHYVPLTGYHDSALFTDDEQPLDSPYVAKALRKFDDLILRVRELVDDGTAEGRAAEFFKRVAVHDREMLMRVTQLLHEIGRGSLPVLPPDTIDVEYEVLPVMISDGCTGGCTFCKFNNKLEFRVRDEDNIREQIIALRDYFGPELMNYNSVVLGQNDALASGRDTLEYAARMAYDELKLAESWHNGSNLYLFGGVPTLLETGEDVFRMFNELPYSNIFVNIGLESPHEPTLDFLGKPQTRRDVLSAFKKLQRINMAYSKMNISCNFMIGDDLPREHIEGVRELLGSVETRMLKGTAFISPLEGHSSHRLTRNDFTKIKIAARMPVYLYLVQRL